MVIVIGNKTVECYSFLPLQNGLLRVQIEIYSFFVSLMTCGYFYVQAIMCFTHNNNMLPEWFVVNSN